MWASQVTSGSTYIIHPVTCNVNLVPLSKVLSARFLCSKVTVFFLQRVNNIWEETLWCFVNTLFPPNPLFINFSIYWLFLLQLLLLWYSNGDFLFSVCLLYLLIGMLLYRNVFTSFPLTYSIISYVSTDSWIFILFFDLKFNTIIICFLSQMVLLPLSVFFRLICVFFFRVEFE